MITSTSFNTRTLQANPWGTAICRILEAAIRAVDPGEAVRQYLQREGDELIVGDQGYDLRSIRRVRIAGMGKAGAPMTEAAASILGDRLTDGIVIVKQGYLGGKAQIGPVRLLEAGHPVPDARSVKATAALIDLFRDSRPDDLVLTLISGGGSALFTQPVTGLVLEDLTGLTRLLLASGADIQEINTLRKHLDQVKGGQLARLFAPARVASLILSDVVGDPLDAIASGPTVPDPTTYAQAYTILEKYELLDRVPGRYSGPPGARPTRHTAGNAQTRRLDFRTDCQPDHRQQPPGCPGSRQTGAAGRFADRDTDHRHDRRSSPGGA